MQVDIRSQKTTVDEVLRAYVNRRLRLTLGRFGGVVAKVIVSIEEAYRNSGAVDKLCQIHVILRPSGDFSVEAVGVTYRDVVDRATQRVARAIDLDLQRRGDAS